jgi:hypothetical protein
VNQALHNSKSSYLIIDTPQILAAKSGKKSYHITVIDAVEILAAKCVTVTQ